MNDEQMLRDQLIRPTKARTAILSYLRQVKFPVGISDILSDPDVQAVGMDQVTAYRVIDKFLEENIVRRIELQEGKFRYELNNRHHHHHAVCSSCGKIVDVTDCIGKDLEAKIEQHTKFTITDHSLEFFGLCQECKTA